MVRSKAARLTAARSAAARIRVARSKTARAKSKAGIAAKAAARKTRPKAQPEQRSKTRPATRRQRDQSRPGDAALALFAHDIRTALTGILALGELLSTSTLDERERQWALGIKAGAEHLAALTTLVIDAAKASAGSLTLQRQNFRPRQIVQVLELSLVARAQSKGLHAETTIADDLPETVIGDPVRLRAALENLVDNAVKFTDKGTLRLDIESKPAGRGRVELVFCVSDSGIGLTPGEIRRLFRPFTQASTEIARRYGGAGLGLSIVKSLAKLMDGDLIVTSTPGRGSRFCFSARLPIARVEAAETPATHAASSPMPGLKILCVDDNPYGRVILNTILTELGHHVDFAASGEEAIAMVARGYDVVLMDVTLPGIDGLETTRRIRALRESTAATPIIGISGHTSSDDEHAATRAGMNSYLRKPLSPRTLSKTLAAVIAR